MIDVVLLGQIEDSKSYLICDKGIFRSCSAEELLTMISDRWVCFLNILKGCPEDLNISGKIGILKSDGSLNSRLLPKYRYKVKGGVTTEELRINGFSLGKCRGITAYVNYSMQIRSKKYSGDYGGFFSILSIPKYGLLLADSDDANGKRMYNFIRLCSVGGGAEVRVERLFWSPGSASILNGISLPKELRNYRAWVNDRFCNIDMFDIGEGLFNFSTRKECGSLYGLGYIGEYRKLCKSFLKNKVLVISESSGSVIRSEICGSGKYRVYSLGESSVNSGVFDISFTEKGGIARAEGIKVQFSKFVTMAYGMDYDLYCRTAYKHYVDNYHIGFNGFIEKYCKDVLTKSCLDYYKIDISSRKKHGVGYSNWPVVE